MKVNMGCGSDLWGDIRVDLKKGSANILADIEQLPFIDQAFSDVRSISVLEHISHWEKALRELLRVTRKRLILEVPVNSDIRKTDIFRLLLPTPKNIRLLFSIPERSRESQWQMNPITLMDVVLLAGFSCCCEKIFQFYCGMPSRCWRITAFRDDPDA